MSSHGLEGEISSVADGEQRARFLASMSEGLHAMAQPLTILRSSVAASAAPEVDPLKQRRYLDLSNQQIERACNLFELLQDLVIASQIEAECGPIKLADLLPEVAKDQGIALQASGVELRMVTPSGLPTVMGDANRTRQALSTALKLAASVSATGDIVELLAFARGGYVELIVRNDRVHGKPLNSSERLSLSVAQANMLSQQGEYEYAEDPFCTSMTLPIQFSGAEAANARLAPLRLPSYLDPHDE
jgi:signal transduction histidine kinase